MATLPAADRSTWLCPDDAHRERLLDMDERLERPRAAAFGVLGAALLIAGPTLGWWPVGLLLAAGAGFAVAGRMRTRVRHPEYAVLASWVFAQIIIAVAVVRTGGPQSPAVLWLAIPVVTLPARFGMRGVAFGVALTAVLILVATRGVEPVDHSAELTATLFPLAALFAIGILSSTLMRSDLDHRTDAVIDGLTGMLNRRALTQRLSELAVQAGVTGEPIAVVMADLDHFKRVNDEHGHARGDAVLVDVAYRMRKELRAFDLIYRLGGEEFLVVLPGADLDAALVVAERLRLAVCTAPAAGLPVTMSLGVASSERDGFEPELVLAAADSQLYRAKRSGRDRVSPTPGPALTAAALAAA